MRPPTSKTVSSRLMVWLAGGVICVGGCHRETPPPSSDAAPAQALLRLTLPELPQRPLGSDAVRQKVVALLAEDPAPYFRAQVQFLFHLAAQDQALELDFRPIQGSLAVEEPLAAVLANPPAALLLQFSSPLSTTAVATLSSLKEAGVALVALDPPAAQQSLFDASVSCDPAKIGKTAAALLVKALTKRAVDLRESSVSGNVMTLRGSDSDPVGQRIHQGLVAALEAHSGIRLVHDAPADWSLTNAATRFTEALRLQQRVDVVFAHDDLLGQAVHQIATEKEVRDALLLIGVNGFAGSEGGIEMIRTLQLDATCQRPFLVDVAWRLIQRHLAGEPPPEPPHILLSPRPITPSDLDQPKSLHPTVDDL